MPPNSTSALNFIFKYSVIAPVVIALTVGGISPSEFEVTRGPLRTLLPNIITGYNV